MKQRKWFWRGFGRGFLAAVLTLCLLVGCLWGMMVAERNTRSVGFGQDGYSRVFWVDKQQKTICLLGWECSYLWLYRYWHHLSAIETNRLQQRMGSVANGWFLP